MENIVDEINEELEAQAQKEFSEVEDTEENKEETSEEIAEENKEDETTLEEVVKEADDKNKKGFAASLRLYGESYLEYRERMECAKECIKSLFERAKREGITKDMICAYSSAVQLEEFNAKVLCSAVQQELGLVDGEEEITPNPLETEENGSENTSEEITNEEGDNVQQEEQSDNQSEEEHEL